MGANVLVTGASSGIGAATALAFARSGATVGICARREDRLTEVLAQCREHAPDSRMWVVDLADLDALPAFVARAEEELGGIDVLVNNAGVPKRRRSATLTLEDAHDVMRTNYYSPVALTVAALPAMLARGSGDIVNVSSMGVHMVAFGVGAYAASKAALEMFTEALYVEIAGTGVQVHLLVPGTTLSEFSTDKPGNDPPFPLDPRTAATPEQVADAIVACVDDDRFLTFATDRDAATAAAKAADPNGFLVKMREALGGLRDG
ncbi:MAG: SDR family oxidoreductase [Acidimicrobiia bacterium]